MVSKERHKFNSDSKTSRGGLVRCSLAFHHCNERFATRTREKWIAFKSEFHLVNKNEYKTEDESELEPRLTPLTKIIILGGKNSGRVKIEFFVPSGLSAVEGGSVSRKKSRKLFETGPIFRTNIQYEKQRRFERFARSCWPSIRRRKIYSAFAGGINMGCRLSCRVLPYLVHENAFESECTRATMHAALETCVCPRDVIAPFCRR